MPKLINGVAYEISQPYAEGHVVTEAEARVLNQTRAENIGNNLRAKLKEQAEAGASTEVLAALVSELDSTYVFTLAGARQSRQLDPYEREATKIAREMLKTHLGESGRKLTVAPEGLTKEEWEEKVESEVDRIAALDAVVKAARQRVDAKKKQADSLMEALADASL
jgi:hypothetical protein